MTLRRRYSNFDRLLVLWILRAISCPSVRADFILDGKYADYDLAAFIGLPSEPNAETLSKIHQLVAERLQALEKGPPTALPARARSNFARFAALLQLNPTEQRIIEFMACSEIQTHLIDLHRILPTSHQERYVRVVSKSLNLPLNRVAKALAPRSTLITSGLITRDLHRPEPAKFEFHSTNLANHLLHEKYDPAKILRLFGVAHPVVSELTLEDYPHLQPTLDLLLAYLKRVKSTRKRGVNIMIHGAPGTGKTQLTRVLARALDIPLYEVSTTDEDGDTLRDSQRLAALNLAQKCFFRTPALLVFDEAEDILQFHFTERGFFHASKGWFNHFLENNHGPILWISNSIARLDPASSRRFDFVFEVPIPPKAQRIKILKNATSSLLSPQFIEKLAMVEHLSPAVVIRARNVIQTIKRDIPPCSYESAFHCVIGGILKAQGHPTHEDTQVIQPNLYDIGYLNISADLPQIAANLRQRPSARICLYGPPGTGKTSLGHWIAQEVDKPLMVRKASDLLSPYLGATEQNIARTFESAKQDEVVLLIDEIDSFLGNRAKTTCSWEVTQINEMLTQIESFPGILIASTNLIGQLDPASMRRFDMKLHLGYLSPSQAQRLLKSYCRVLKLPNPSPPELKLVGSVETCTPGDFATIARQHRFQPFRDTSSFLRAIIAENDHKSEYSRRIGFL